MDRADVMMTSMFLFMGLLFGVLIQALFTMGDRLDQLTIEITKLIICHNHDIVPCV